MNNRPERMILIAVIAAFVLGLIGSAVSCAIVAPVANKAREAAQNPFAVGPDWWSDDYGDYLGDGYDGLFGGHGDLPDNYQELTEKDIPASMDIDAEELRSDLQAMIEADLMSMAENAAGSSKKDKDASSSSGADQDASSSSSTNQDAAGISSSIKVSKFTPGEITKPRLANGEVLSEAKGTVTIEYDGKTFDVGVTSYYYCDNPREQKPIWFIYAYDLDNYENFPKGFDRYSGDPMGVRDWIYDSGDTANSANLSNEQRRNQKDA